MVVWISSSEKLSRETQMFVGAIVLLWDILTRPGLDLEFSPQDATNVKTREFLVFTTEFHFSNVSHSQANLWTKCGTFIWERSVASIISLLCWNWGKLLSKMNWGQLLSNKNTPHPEALISRAPSRWPSEDATSRAPFKGSCVSWSLDCLQSSLMPWKGFLLFWGGRNLPLPKCSNCFPWSEKINRISETRQDFLGSLGMLKLIERAPDFRFRGQYR